MQESPRTPRELPPPPPPVAQQPHKTTLRRRPTQLALETCSPRSVWRSVAAGYAAGVSGTLVGHPFDSVKVWMQTRGGGAGSGGRGGGGGTVGGVPTVASATTGGGVRGAIAPASFASAAAASPSLQRARALYAGVAGPLLTVGLIQSINFAIYDSSRRMLYGLDHPDASDLEYLHHDPLTNVGMAGAISGLCLCFVTSPLVIVKVKQQAATSSSGLSFVQAWRDTAFPDGRFRLRTMYVGFPLHMLSESFGRVVYYGTYESLKRLIVVHRTETIYDDDAFVNASVPVTRQPISLPERMGCAAAAGIVCWSTIFPIDAIRSRLFVQPGMDVLSDRSHSSWLGLGAAYRIARRMYVHEGGMRVFFRGYSVTVLRAGPVAAAVLPIYDLTLEYLSGL